MPRFTRSALLACTLLLALTSCAPASTGTVFSGRFSPDSPIRLTNQTIIGGRYLVGFSMEVLFSPAKDAVTLTCRVVDTSGQIAGFNDLASTVIAGGWTRIEVEQEYDLPDLTLGIRCAPGSRQLLTAEFRDVQLQIEKR